MDNKKRMEFLGVITGLANGFFGSGGGVVAVPMLKKAGYDTKKAHACSLAVTLPLSAVSAAYYVCSHTFDYKQALTLIPFGLVGAAAGTHFMKKIPSEWLTRIFGIILIIAGGKNLLS